MSENENTSVTAFGEMAKWGNGTFKIGEQTLKGITSINFDYKQEINLEYGAGTSPIGHTRGKEEGSFDFAMHVEQAVQIFEAKSDYKHSFVGQEIVMQVNYRLPGMKKDIHVELIGIIEDEKNSNSEDSNPTIECSGKLLQQPKRTIR